MPISRNFFASKASIRDRLIVFSAGKQNSDDCSPKNKLDADGVCGNATFGVAITLGYAPLAGPDERVEV